MNEEMKQRISEIEREIDEITAVLNEENEEKKVSESKKGELLARLTVLSGEHDKILRGGTSIIDVVPLFEYLDNMNEFLGKVHEEINKISNVDGATIEQCLGRIDELHAISEECDSYLKSNYNYFYRDEDVEAALALKEKISEQKNRCDSLIQEYTKKIVDNYVSTVNRTKNNIKYVLSKLKTNFNELVEINEEISGLVEEYNVLKEKFNDVVKYINNLDDPYSISPKELENRLKEIRDGIKEIKNQQIDNYNRMVSVLNERLSSLSSRVEEIPEELREQFKSIVGLTVCNEKVDKFNARKYLDYLNYTELKKQFLLFAEIEKYLNNREMMPVIPEVSQGNGVEEQPVEVTVEEALMAELRNIEDKIISLNNSYDKDMSYDEYLKYEDEILYIERLLDLFMMNYYDSKDKVIDNKKIDGHLSKCFESLNYLKNLVLSKKNKPMNSDGEYKNLLQEIAKVSDRIEYTVNILMEPAFEDKNVSKNVIDGFNNILDKLFQELDNLKTKITKLHEEGKLDDVQYNNLKVELDKKVEQIVKGREFVNAFETIREKGFFDLLTGEISGLEEAIKRYGEKIDSYEKPIDKAKRSELDQIYNAIENEIQRIQTNLEKYKDTDPVKYQSEIEKLEKCKLDLNELNTKYRSKCGLVVKTWRSAKKFYKKHKKTILICVGLATIALLAKPVLIPAIMQGNLFLSGSMPSLAPVLSTINKGLGDFIGAEIVKTTFRGVTIYPWRLASGAFLTANTTTAALLKGIASVSLGSAPLIGGVVMSLKLLTNKMKKREKQDESKLGKAVVGKVHDLTEKAKTMTQKTKKHSLTNPVEITKKLQELNPNVEVRLENADFSPRIYSSVPAEQLVLPDGFEFNDKNGITNKHQTSNGQYVALEVVDLSLADESKLLPKFNNSMKMTNTEKKLNKYFEQLSDDEQRAWLDNVTQKGRSR